MFKQISSTIIGILIIGTLFAVEDPAKTKKISFNPELLPMAKNGDPESQRKLGQCYLFGKGVEKNTQEGIKWLQKSAETENLNALVLLFGIYLKGEFGADQDMEKAVSYLQRAANKKATDQQTKECIAGFQCVLGNFYETGNGVKKDLKEAIRWYEKSADAGNPLGEASLGALYYDGRGVPRDPAKAVEFFEKSAKKNDIRGMTGLALCYYKGDGIPKDYDKAYEILKKIVKEDDRQSSALKMLGLCYYYGNGTKKNAQIAKDYFVRAKNAGATDVDAFITDLSQN